MPLRVALVDVRVPAADVDERDVELVAHQPGHAPRFELEAARGDGVAVGGLHLARHSAVGHHLGLLGDRSPQIEAFGDQRLEARALVHVGEHAHLPIVERRPAGALERDVGHEHVAFHDDRQPVGERHRRGAAIERDGQAVEEARARRRAVRLPAIGIPTSTLSCVSKWLRERSSLPANGTNASCPSATAAASSP